MQLTTLYAALQKAKRECGGAMRNISVYPTDDPAVIVAIKTFYGQVIS